MSLKIQLLCISILGVFLTPLNAQENLSIVRALSIAKENNTRMIQARNDIEVAKARLSSAKAYVNPEIYFEMYGSKNGKNSYEFNANQEIDLVGKRKAREMVVEADIAVAGEILNLIWSDVALEIKEAYYELLLMDKKKSLAQENLTLFRKLLDSVQLKYNSGKVLLSEVMRAKIELSQAENELSLADKELRVARAKFNLLLNKPRDYEFAAIDSLEFEYRNLDLKMLIQKAAENNPELKVRTIIAQRNQNGIILEKRNIFTNPSFGYVQKGEKGNILLGASVSIGLPLWNQNTGAIREAEIETQKANQDVEYLKKQLEVTVYDAYIEAEAAAKQAITYRRSIEQSTEIQNQIDLQFKEGKIDFLSYLDSLRTVKNVKLGYFDSVVSYNKKIALIDKLTGKE